MQLADGTVDGDLESSDSANAEEDLLAAALVHRAIADEPNVGTKCGFVLRQASAQSFGELGGELRHLLLVELT